MEARPNGEAALERILKRRPDVLITDIEMPKMTGEELCKKIHKDLPDRQFPIFVATSVTAIEHRVWSKDIPNLRFMEKPISASKLLDAIAEELHSSSGHANQRTSA